MPFLELHTITGMANKSPNVWQLEPLALYNQQITRSTTPTSDRPEPQVTTTATALSAESSAASHRTTLSPKEKRPRKNTTATARSTRRTKMANSPGVVVIRSDIHSRVRSRWSEKKKVQNIPAPVHTLEMDPLSMLLLLLLRPLR